MKIGGIIEASKEDIPGKVCMVVFTIGCNFNCKFCYNKHLLMKDAGKEYSIKQLLGAIKNNFLIKAVSITGGEPTLQEDIIMLCAELKKLGIFVSIDTNGSKPSMIKQLLPHIDRIAFDLMGPLKEERLEEITQTAINPNIFIETYDLINKDRHVNFEVRTTYVKNLLTPKDINYIISFLKHKSFSGNYVLQQYQYSNGVEEKLKEKYQIPEHNDLLNILKPYLNETLPFQLYIRDDIVGYSEIHKVFQEIL
jgi:pyruvate formate lyase activating enzyme